MPPPAGPPVPSRADLPGLLDELARRGETLATAESLTGGGVAHAVTDVPGSSRVLVGAVVAYATRVKTDLLGVPEPVVAEDGVVSPACARAMAAGVRRVLGSTWGVATTGVAGPGPEDGVPAGTVYVGLAGPGVDRAVALVLDGDRGAVRAATVRAAVAALAEELLGAAPGTDGTIGPSGSVDPGPSGPEDLR